MHEIQCFDGSKEPSSIEDLAAVSSSAGGPGDTIRWEICCHPCSPIAALVLIAAPIAA
mgnify:CR=1 FL=1